VPPKKGLSAQLIRYAAAIVCLTFLLVMAWVNANTGLSRLRYRTTSTSLLPTLTQIAVRQTPSDPDAHYALANALLEANRFAEAVAEYEEAVNLRPRDYFLWMELGYALVQNCDDDRAYVAYQTAANLAPHYTQPRVRLGEFLLRMRRREEAFQQFRHAANLDHTLLPKVTELAISEFRNPVDVLHVLQPITAAEKMALASSFLRAGYLEEALKLFYKAGNFTDANRKELVNGLLQAKRYKEAYQVWISTRSVSEKTTGPELLINGEFESAITLDETGFGWRVPRMKEVHVSLSVEDPHSGRGSLSISYTGESDPSTPAISQIILVRPHSSYTFSYTARTEDLVTGGPPVVAIINPATNHVLAESEPLTGSHSWRPYQLEFSTDESEAVTIAIYRQRCTFAGPICAAFGRVWFDSFRLVEHQ
jgi:tetratricopeptide (TPR) repeat protein